MNVLMLKDISVLKFDFDNGEYEVLREYLLPHVMQGSFRRVPTFEEVKTKYDDTQREVARRHNQSLIDTWAAHRLLPLSRSNAKKVYGALRLEQYQDAKSKAKITYSCRAISLQDNYWLRLDGEDVKWKDVNLRNNSLNTAIALISLHGTSLSIKGRPTTPELTGQGAYAKAWFREDNNIYLYKAGADGNAEARIEVMVSNLLDKTNVDHLHYDLKEHESLLCSRCKCMTNDDISILSATDFSEYCNHNKLNFMEECKRIDSEMLYKMWIVDFLISNRDRHGMNWGFFIDSNTNEILGMHPLYDHNNAFDIEYMKDINADYQVVENMTIRQAAELAMSKVDFHFTTPIEREDFITDRQYNSFMERAKLLGVETYN